MLPRITPTVARLFAAGGAALALGLAATGCGSDDDDGGEDVTTPLPGARDEIRLRSAAFAQGGRIPRRYTCEGKNVSPPLRWSRVPRGAIELALLMEDRDAPDGTFVHWTVYGIPPATAGIAAGRVPLGAREGRTSFEKARYGGPCPPRDDRPHRYVFAIYGLSERLRLGDGASADQVRAAVDRVAIARGLLRGRYGRRASSPPPE
jgi:Raf kinase inhibitor-like YbhB/YbcL family protein